MIKKYDFAERDVDNFFNILEYLDILLKKPGLDRKRFEQKIEEEDLIDVAKSITIFSFPTYSSEEPYKNMFAVISFKDGRYVARGENKVVEEALSNRVLSSMLQRMVVSSYHVPIIEEETSEMQKDYDKLTKGKNKN